MLTDHHPDELDFGETHDGPALKPRRRREAGGSLGGLPSADLNFFQVPLRLPHSVSLGSGRKLGPGHQGEVGSAPSASQAGNRKFNGRAPPGRALAPGTPGGTGQREAEWPQLASSVGVLWCCCQMSGGRLREDAEQMQE